MYKTNIYHGDAAGGPVDYGFAVAQVDGNTVAVADVGPGESRWYAVRVFDPSTDMEEYGTAAQILLIRGPDGSDWTDRPGAPVGVRVTMAVGGTAVVTWTCLPRPDRADPTSFSVRVTPGPAVDWTADPAAIVVVGGGGSVQYSATLSGLVDGTAYAVGVRGVRGTVDDGNTAATTFVADSAAPANVRALSSEAVFYE